ncbi:MAG TPA: hypothetical protein VGN72_07735 [Tepidisphaeraceae bacterium]|jgi:hypothetical protein|nr:hypothetical protein [Tepidisphaeraceae bacterium]
MERYIRPKRRAKRLKPLTDAQSARQLTCYRPAGCEHVRTDVLIVTDRYIARAAKAESPTANRVALLNALARCCGPCSPTGCNPTQHRFALERFDAATAWKRTQKTPRRRIAA